MKKFNWKNIISIMLILILIIMFFGYDKVPTPEINTKINNNTKDNIKSNLTTIQETENKNLLPDSNYSCDEIIPDEALIVFMSGGKILGKLELKNGKKLSADPSLNPCKINRKVGENIYLFSCSIGYYIRNRVSEEGIILQNYQVSFDLGFDERNCSFSYNAAGGGAYNCKILTKSCSWKFF